MGSVLCHRYSCNCFPPDGHLDVDQVNCHPRFLFALVRDCGTILPAEYAALQDYVERCDAIFATEGPGPPILHAYTGRFLFDVYGPNRSPGYTASPNIGHGRQNMHTVWPTRYHGRQTVDGEIGKNSTFWTL